MRRGDGMDTHDGVKFLRWNFAYAFPFSLGSMLIAYTDGVISGGTLRMLSLFWWHVDVAHA